jgi:hypothetical protein
MEKSIGRLKLSKGNVEKTLQRRSRHFAVLTYWKYAPRVKAAAALLDDFFEHSRRLLKLKYPRAYMGFFEDIFNRTIK